MDKEQFLLLKIAEECSEVSQRALKSAQFGLDESQTDQDKDNLTRLAGELGDLLGVIDMLNDQLYGEDGSIYTLDECISRRSAKSARVEKYLKHSQALGKVDVDYDPEMVDKVFETL